MSANAASVSESRRLTVAHYRSLFSYQNINGVWIPSALLIVGTAIVKVQWLPYAAALALALGTWKLVGASTYLATIVWLQKSWRD